MRFRKKWLDIPQLHQKNAKNKNWLLWCGRTSASMVHNYYKMVAGEVDALIANKVNANSIVNDKNDPKRNLLYPAAPGAAAEIAAPGFKLMEPMERIDGAGRWKREKLYPVAGRDAAALTAEKIQKILQPVFDSIDANNPLVFFSSISMGREDAKVGPGIQHTRHIIVISGYKLDAQGELWLHIDDTVTMESNNSKITWFGKDNLRILDPGEAATRGARYWLCARRLFEKNERSEDPDDLWCDHSDSKGFEVIHHKDRVTPNTRAHETTAFVFPVGEATACIPSNVISLHRAVEHQSRGGYFPLGANGIWHGGVHLPCPGGGEVRACADGRIVAARLGEDADTALGEFGSVNFILLRHEVTGDFLNQVENRQKLTGFKVLQRRKLRPSAATSGQEVAMLGKADELSLLDSDEVDDGGYRWVHVKVTKAGAPDRVGKEGWVAHGSEFFSPLNEVEEVFAKEDTYTWYSLYMHLDHPKLSADSSRLAGLKWLSRSFTRVKSSLNLRSAPQTTGAPNVIGVLAAGDRVERLAPAAGTTVPAGWGRVRVVSAANVSLGGQEGFVATAFLQDASEADPAVLDQLRGGAVVKLDLKVAAGDQLWWAGTVGSDQCGQATTIHWEIFSDSMLLPSWRTAEDDDDDLTVDSQTILSLLQQEGWGTNESLTMEEIARFYAQDIDAPKLRTWACLFRSEWAMDPDKAVSKLSSRWWTAGLKAQLQPYQWWKEGEDAGVPLPSSPVVWHYNPIALLAAFSRLGGEGAPGEVIDIQDWFRRTVSEPMMSVDRKTGAAF